MARRKANALASAKFKRELTEYYHGAKRCVCCADYIDEPIWHHILPVALGGEDIVTNMVPICHACHMAIHNMKPAFYYRFKASPGGGRPKDHMPWYDNIYDDYVMCRIPKTVASERLGKGVHFQENAAFREFLKKNRILKFRNNIDLIASKNNGYVEPGRIVGHVEYMDGTRKELRYGEEKPKSDPIPLEESSGYASIKYFDGES